MTRRNGIRNERSFCRNAESSPSEDDGLKIDAVLQFGEGTLIVEGMNRTLI